MLLGLNMRRTLGLFKIFDMRTAKYSIARPVEHEMPRCWQEETEVLLKASRFPTQSSPLQMDTRITVISVEYRLMPENPPQKALDDTYEAFLKLTETKRSSERVILAGSSSGGQLAAQVAQLARVSEDVPTDNIDGLLLHLGCEQRQYSHPGAFLRYAHKLCTIIRKQSLDD
jgi:hypothetical protein